MNNEGINYMIERHMCRKLQTHEKCPNHIYSHKAYLNAVSAVEQNVSDLPAVEIKENTKKKREVLLSILKAIIFMATHSKYFDIKYKK